MVAKYLRVGVDFAAAVADTECMTRSPLPARFPVVYAVVDTEHTDCRICEGLAQEARAYAQVTGSVLASRDFHGNAFGYHFARVMRATTARESANDSRRLGNN